MSVINLTLIQSFVPNQATYFNFNGVSWTLSVEMFFYLTFPFLLFFFSKINIKKHVFISISVLCVVWLGIFHTKLNLDENNTFYVWLLHIFPVARLFEFAAGIMLGLIFVSRFKKGQVVNKKTFSWLEFMAITVFLGSMAYSVNFGVGAVRGGFFIPVWCLLIYVFAHQGGIFSKILSNKILVYLGEISFSFYMIHQLVIRYYELFQFNKAYMAVACFAITLILSGVIYRFYEEPLRKRIRYGSQKKEPTVTAKESLLIQIGGIQVDEFTGSIMNLYIRSINY